MVSIVTMASSIAIVSGSEDTFREAVSFPCLDWGSLVVCAPLEMVGFGSIGSCHSQWAGRRTHPVFHTLLSPLQVAPPLNTLVESGNKAILVVSPLVAQRTRCTD